MNQRPLALFDLDMTLADYEGRLRADLDRLASPGDPPIGPIHGGLPPHIEARKHAITSTPGWWLGLDRYQPGWDILGVAVELGFRIAALSKIPYLPLAAAEKLQWADRHLTGVPKFKGLTVCHGSKGAFYARVLVDDWPEYVSDWLRWRPRGLAILPVHPHNQGFSHPNAIRFDGSNLDEVRTRLEAARDRKVGSTEGDRG